MKPSTKYKLRQEAPQLEEDKKLILNLEGLDGLHEWERLAIGAGSRRVFATRRALFPKQRAQLEEIHGRRTGH